MRGPALPHELGQLGCGCWQLLPVVYRGRFPCARWWELQCGWEL